jgi:hypothetical protein
VKRPIGVTMLSILHVIGGMVVLVPFANVLILKDNNLLVRVASMLELPAIFQLAGLGLFSVMLIASGIGLWFAKSWGWWAAAFFYLDRTGISIIGLVLVSHLSNEPAVGPRGAGHYLVQYGIRILISVIILIYLFRGNVRTFFQLVHVPRLRCAAVLTASYVAFMVIVSLVAAKQ